MNRKRRTEILIKGSTSIAKGLAEEIQNKYDVKVIEEPNYGLIMVKMREGAKKSLFYLGEVLVTETKVQINGKLGIGIVKGNNPDLSLYLAIIDAAYNLELKETKAFKDILLKEEEKINNENKKYKSKILKSKVNFDTMDV
ncbi:MAG: phosphonate C-P lyase system protein PhnG [Firmicutes bacterium]|nr:phosphonate C-P lyase system protein PhnG [Bacillota bacterium]